MTAATRTRWETLELPAMAEEGDPLGRRPGAALWPERFDDQALAELKEDVGPRAWDSLYQQKPKPDAGVMYLKAWTRYWRHSWEPEPTNPEHARRCSVLPRKFNEVFQSWDLAFKDTLGSCPVAGGKIGCNGARRYLLDVDWERKSFVKCMDDLPRLAAQEPKGLATVVEDKANGPAAINMLSTKLPGIFGYTPKGSKRARFAAVTPIFRAGQFFIHYYHPRRDEIEQHLADFPLGAQNDLADMLSQALDYSSGRDYDEVPDEQAHEGSRAWEKEMEQRLVEQQLAEQEDLERW